MDRKQLSHKIYELIEDVHHDKVIVANKTYAVNALTLLRDALLDLDAMYSMAKDLSAEQLVLMKQQIEKEEFSGPLHAEYHKIAGRYRSALIALHQQSKRFLNSSSYVLVSFTPHGIALKTGSFGKQYSSAQKIDLSKLDNRTKKLIKLIIKRGPKLEEHNNHRDQFIEHTVPARSRRQVRPAVSAEGMSYLQDKQSPGGPTPPLFIEGKLIKSMPGWAQVEQKDTAGNKNLIYILHVQTMMVPLTQNTFVTGYVVVPPPEDKDHFADHEPHTHHFLSEGEGIGELSPDNRHEIVVQKAVEELVRDYYGYVKALLDIIKTNPVI